MGNRRRIFRLIVILISILFVVIAIEWYALRVARRAFDELMFRNGLGSASVMIEACRTVYGFQVMREFERESRLIFASDFVPRNISAGDVEAVAKKGQLPFVVFTDFDGTIVYRSSPSGELYSQFESIRENLAGIYENGERSVLFGIDRELPLEEGPKGLAMRVENGVVVMFAPEPTPREREELTLGRMIGRLGENPEVRYLALQDESGFIFATKAVRTLSSLASDEFLEKVYSTGIPSYRYTNFSNERVFELALVFPKMGRYHGVLRVGFSSAEYDKLFRGYVLQIGVILILAIIAAIGAIALSYTARRLAAQVGLSEAIVSEMSAACIAVDPSGNISLINPLAGKFFGLRSREAVGRSYISVFPHDELGIGRLASNEHGYSSRIEIETQIGRRTLDISAGKLRDGGAFAVAEDITDLIELKKEAAGAEHLRALGELAAGVAHEIRNPLNAIGIVAQRLSAEFKPTEDEAEYRGMLKDLRAEISRLDNIIREFIGLSAPMAPALSLQPLRPLIDEIESAARLRAVGSGIEFQSKIEFDGLVEFDGNQLKKALLNLIKNAVEATPAGGLIRFEVSRRDDKIRLAVFDDGPPVPKGVLDKLGKPFVSAGKEAGTGIGLFVAFRVAKDHGGKIEVDSNENGTTFTIILPLR